MSSADNDPSEQIYDACRTGNLESFKSLIESKEEGFWDPNGVTLRGHDDCKLIHVAARFNQVSMMQYLYDNGAQLEITDRMDATPLFYACSNGSLDAVSFLASNGALINVKDRYEFSPLMMAVRERHFAVADFLIMMSADPNLKITTKGGTILHYCCEHGNVEGVKYALRQRDISVLRTDRSGDTCLFYALPYPEIISILCQRARHERIFSKLIKVANSRGENVIHAWAGRETSHLDTLDTLVSEMLRESYTTLVQIMNEPDKKQANTPLHFAVRSKRTDFVQRLCRFYRYLNLSQPNKSGDTPLHSAVKQINYPMVDTLTKADRFGNSLSVLDAQNQTPESLAVEIHRPRIIQSLLIAREELHKRSVLELVEEEVHEHNFTVLIFFSYACISEQTLTDFNVLVDLIYAAGATMLGITTRDQETIDECIKAWDVKYRIISDMGGDVATRFGLTATKKKVTQFFKRLLERSKSFSGGSLPNSAPTSPTSTPLRMSLTPRSSPRTTPRTGSGSPLPVKSGNKKTEELNVQPSVIVLDKNGGVVFLHSGGTLGTNTLDVTRILTFYLTCYAQNLEVGDCPMEPKEDIYDWVLSNESIRKQFLDEIVGQWSDPTSVDVDKLSRSIGDKDKKSLLKRKFDIRGFEEDSTLALYKNYIHKKHNGEHEISDARRDAFLSFVKAQQEQTSMIITPGIRKTVSLSSIQSPTFKKEASVL
jgi:ankyrin repeat protein